MSNKIVQAEITGLAFGGDCIGTAIEGDTDIIGKKIFLPFVIPGEIVRAEITKEEKRLLKGNLLEIIKNSENRTEAPCKLYQKCGGCELQHIEITAQRKFKQEMVLSMLEKQGGIKPEEFEFLAPDMPPYNYRSRITLHLSLNSEIGFYKKNSSEVVDLGYCHISSELINESIKSIRKYRNKLSADFSSAILEEFESKIYLVLKSRAFMFSYKAEHLPPGLMSDFPNLKIMSKNELLFSTLEDDYSAGHFSQVNHLGNKYLIETVLKHADSKIVTDLYAGHGNFAIPLARSGKIVDLVEIDSKLVKYAKSQLQGSPWQENVDYFEMTCEKFFTKNEAAETVVLDPPRNGAKTIIQYLNNQKTRQVIYVSCNLPSFCRDLKELQSFGFKLKKLYLLDMFSQTHHIEMIGILTKNN